MDSRTRAIITRGRDAPESSCSEHRDLGVGGWWLEGGGGCPALCPPLSTQAGQWGSTKVSVQRASWQRRPCERDSPQTRLKAPPQVVHALGVPLRRVSVPLGRRWRREGLGGGRCSLRGQGSDPPHPWHRRPRRKVPNIQKMPPLVFISHFVSDHTKKDAPKGSQSSVKILQAFPEQITDTDPWPSLCIRINIDSPASPVATGTS